VTIRQVSGPSDRAGQSAGKAGRLPRGIRRRGRKLPRRDPTEPVHTVRLATRPRVPCQPEPERSSILELLRARLGCGRVRPNARAGGRDRSLVYVVRNRDDLLTKVIPFFRAHPILSEKRLEFETFAVIVTAMENREHLSAEGFHRLLDLAVKMNGGGRYRRLDWSSRILRGHTPNTGISP
jgi:hypothetical protein